MTHVYLSILRPPALDTGRHGGQHTSTLVCRQAPTRYSIDTEGYGLLHRLSRGTHDMGHHPNLMVSSFSEIWLSDRQCLSYSFPGRRVTAEWYF